MAIGTDDAIFKFGTQDPLETSGGTITNNSYVAATTNWTNDDDAPLAALWAEFTFGTAVTTGSIGCYFRLLDIEGTNDTPAVTADFPHVFVGSFPVVFNSTAIFRTAIPLIQVPQMETSAAYTVYLKNEGTGQSVSSGWKLWVTPITEGPHA